MDCRSEFQRNLASFLSTQPSKAAAARVLGISRQDFYRYLDGSTSPRLRRRKAILVAMGAAAKPDPKPSIEGGLGAMSRERVTELRDVMLHLVSLLELDLASRDGD